MAIVKTDRAHYEGIADALRSLHDGEERYTPAQMAEYLATQGTELKPENIAEGITIFGVTGTMRYPMYDEWPVDPPVPPESEFDEVAKELDPEAPNMDKMLLMDDKGNITVGYLYNTAVTGLYDYGGAALPRIPDIVKPYAFIIATYASTGKISSAKLYCADGAILYDPAAGQIWTNGDSWAIYSYSAYSGQWGELTYGSSSAIYAPRAVVDLGNSEEIIWANSDIKHKGTSAVWLAGSTATAAEFTITAYDYRTTDFRAIGWIRVAYHTTGEYKGQFTVDDFRTTESGGWNYIQNVRWSTRAKLSYMDTDIWPQGPQMYNYDGYTLPVSLEELLTSTHPYVFICYTYQRAYACASATPLVMNSGGGVQTDANQSTFSFKQRQLSHQSGKPAGREYNTKTVNIITGTKIWANYTLYKTTGGVGFEESPDPVPVRRPDPVL